MGGIRKVIKNERGFTLIELMVVIVIIGIIAALVVPKVTNVLGSAKEETDKANLQTLQTAVERVYAKTGSYPTSSNLESTLENGYIKEFPSDPQGGTYSIKNDGTVYCQHYQNGVSDF